MPLGVAVEVASESSVQRVPERFEGLDILLDDGEEGLEVFVSCTRVREAEA